MSSHAKSSRKPKLPVAQLVILSICRFAEPVALTGVNPYLPEMIESFHVPRDQIAKWAGTLSAAFSISQCLTAIFWGRASDKYGRKPIILLALTTAMLSSLLFGFSTNLKWAMFARALSGISNGNVGTLRTTVAEMVPERSLQPRAFSIMPLVWQIGAVIGPIMGGWLASPARTMPEIFKGNKLLTKYPYALPNLVSGVFFTIGLTTGLLFLKEALEAKKHQRDYGRAVGACLLGCCSHQKRNQNHRDDFESKLPSSKAPRKTEALGAPKYRDVFTQQSSINLLVYTILALHSGTFNQLLPVFMHLPVQRGGVSLPFSFNGGFGLDSGRIGLLFTVYGGFSMVAQFTLFPYATKRLGVLFCLRVSSLIFPLVYMIAPYTVLCPTPATQQAAVLGVLLLKGVADVFSGPCITILMTNSAKSLRLLGTLNGVATSVSAIGRAMGPYLAGQVFTWGVSAGYIIAAWWLLAVFAVMGHAASWWLIEMDGFSAPEKGLGSDDDREAIGLISNPGEGIKRQTSWDVDTVVGADGDESDEDEDEPLLRRETKELQ
jgi:hypothetical protein